MTERTDNDAPEGTHDEGMQDALIAAALALAGRRIVVLTGAGISTESGIPDYRGDKTRAEARRPMRFATFAASEDARRRYWARATLGWPRVRDAQPNDAHLALAHLERRRLLGGVITQNVDGLHDKAGSRDVVELHGALRETLCLGCGVVGDRDALHVALVGGNQGLADAPRVFAPDGDVDVDETYVASFAVIPCGACGAPLKPRVVFFGENVPAPTLADAWRVFEAGSALLVIGTSLEVFSGRRFVEEAARRAWPIVLINRGPTRADALATVRIDARAGTAVPALVDALSPGRASP